MKWFILVIMSVINWNETDDGDRDTYLFVNPTFDTYNECAGLCYEYR